MNDNKYNVSRNEYDQYQESKRQDSWDDYSYDPDMDFSSLRRMKGHKKNDLKRYNENLNYIYRDLVKNGYSDTHIATLLGTIAEESLGDPYARSDSGAYHGLLQWGKDRYRINPFLENEERSNGDKAELDRQLKLIYDTIDNLTDRKSWTKGFEESGYRSAREAHDAWLNAQNIHDASHALNFGYVRPGGRDDSVKNRAGVSNVVEALMKKRAQDIKDYRARYVLKQQANQFAEGTDDKNDPGFTPTYKKLRGGYKKKVDEIASEMNFNDVESSYNSGLMNPALAARFKGLPNNGRAREQTSKTPLKSKEIEASMNYQIYNGNKKR